MIGIDQAFLRILPEALPVGYFRERRGQCPVERRGSGMGCVAAFGCQPIRRRQA
jgi:hypothetical protein